VPDAWQVRVTGQVVSVGPVQVHPHKLPTLDCRHEAPVGVAGQGAVGLQG